MLTLKKYQTEISLKARAEIKQHHFAYLSMECRTGKTITAFETARICGFKTVLFVTKKKAMQSILNDYEHYKNEFKCVVINYDSVLKVPNLTYNCIIVDEAHSLGTYPKKSKRVLDLLELTFENAIYLSATPTPESYSQIYHQLAILKNRSPFAEYKTFYKWAVEFVKLKQRKFNGFMVNDYSEANVEKITKFFKPITFTQSQAGFDSQIKEEVLFCDMSIMQQNMIKTLVKDRIIEGKTSGVIADTAVKLQNKIHQLSSGTIITEAGDGFIISDQKAKFIKGYFGTRKIAIFYKFKQEFECLKGIFSNWTDNSEQFQQSNDATFLGQFVSSREGVRLDTADAIVFYNIDFSYLSYAQAKERIISGERTKEAVLYWVFSNGGIEQKIYEVVKQKKDFTNYYFKKAYELAK